MGVVLEFLGWLARKIGIGLLLVITVLGIWMAVIWVREQSLLEQDRLIRLQTLRTEHLRVEAALSEAGTRLEALKASFEVQQDRARRLEKIIETLAGLQDWWNALFGDPEQNRRNQEQIARAKGNHEIALLRISEISEQVRSTLGTKSGLETEHAALMAALSREETASGFFHTLRSAWERARMPIFLLLLGYFLGPSITKVIAFYGFGALLDRGRPIVIRKEARGLPEVTSGGVSIEVGLWAGEAAWVKEHFLQSSDEGLARKTRLLFDWSIPMTALSCGLVELVELSHGHAGEPLTITLSDMDDPHNELALVRVPDGGSIVLRPSFIAAVIKPLTGTLCVRRRWRLFNWQSWISGQFRYFEFEGPVKLAVVGSRGVRAEWLKPNQSGGARARRTNQDATIGFTPNLRYRPVRAETFWAYYRGKNPLFDDLFEGEGVFLCQEIIGDGPAGKARAFWSRVWDSMLKIFGI